LCLELLPLSWVLPAPGQGALAVECRARDARTRRLARAVHSLETDACVRAERACLAALGGGCRLPLGAYARPVGKGGSLHLAAWLTWPDGSGMTRIEVFGPASKPEALGRRAARSMQRAHADDDEDW
jgi:hydroxymethylbilane synthase